jgi:hypothetical protein
VRDACCCEEKKRKGKRKTFEHWYLGATFERTTNETTEED